MWTGKKINSQKNKQTGLYKGPVILFLIYIYINIIIDYIYNHLDDAVELVHRGCAWEHGLATQHLAEDAADGPDVHPLWIFVIVIIVIIVIIIIKNNTNIILDDDQHLTEDAADGPDIHPFVYYYYYYYYCL